MEYSKNGFKRFAASNLLLWCYDDKYFTINGIVIAVA